jgi:hypothetical protein
MCDGKVTTTAIPTMRFIIFKIEMNNYISPGSLRRRPRSVYNGKLQTLRLG